MNRYQCLIQHAYMQSGGDSRRLFQTILSLAGEIGLEQALAYLETCVIEKRLAWLAANLTHQGLTGDPLWDGYHLFYATYLGVSAPFHGEIIAQDERRLVMRWWNPCPTLEACQTLGLDTRQVCRLAYHRPVQEFLVRIDPRLRFERNYAALRPHTLYCEEMIMLERNTCQRPPGKPSGG